MSAITSHQYTTTQSTLLQSSLKAYLVVEMDLLTEVICD